MIMQHRDLVRLCYTASLYLMLALPGAAPAELLAVIDRSNPATAGLNTDQLSQISQVVRGETKRRLPEDIAVLSEENTVSILKDMGVDLATCEGECEVDIARKLQADWLISTKLVRFGSQWSLQVNLFKTATGELMGSERLTARQEEELADGAERATGLLCVKVAVPPSGAAAGGRIGEQPEAWDPGSLLGVMVTFESEPAGAALALDGSYLGDTPLTREIAPGPHRVEWTLARYESLQEALQVEQATTVRRTLTPLFGWLSVESTPAGQPVFVDGVRTGATPLQNHVLGHGTHAVLVGDSALAYPQGERFTLGKGERKALRFQVPLREGALVVRCADLQGNAVSVPVKVDGTDRGASPLQLKLPIGEHTVEAGGQRRTVSLREKVVETVELQVERAAGQSAGTAMSGPLPGMACVTIPAGSFQMGSPDSETGRDTDEGPQHHVTLSSFALMTTEVTQAQWRAVMGSNPSYFKGDDRPVEQVSWNDVQDFLRKLNQRDPGKGYRLPTEAEWEYVCRAGSTKKWCFGDGESRRLGDYALYDVNSGGRTHPVGQKLANAWGLHDMHGNVWEWCQDLYRPYAAGTETDPPGAPSGSYRVARGGCWINADWYCRSSSRINSEPSGRNRRLGFRVARTLP